MQPNRQFYVEDHMSLTGAALPILLGLLAAGLFVALTLGLPVIRQRWAAVAARGGGIVVLNVLVLALVGSLMNDYFGFYVSWSDLAGARSPVTVTHHGASAQEAASRHMASPLAPPPAVLPGLEASGRVQSYTKVQGARSHITGKVLVLLPKGYRPDDPARYPVIEALHGFPGSPPSWFSGMDLQQAVDGAVSAHAMAPSIVVLPQANVPLSIDTECVNGPPGTPQVETWLADDVPRFVTSHFRVRTDRASWAVMGYSEGAWCAAMVGVLHPNVFGGEIQFSGAFHPEFTHVYRPFGLTYPARYNLISLARRHPPALAMWIQASKKDGYAYPPTAAFLKVVRSPLSVTTDLLKTGGHREALWAEELPTALRWLGKSLPGFAPARLSAR